MSYVEIKRKYLRFIEACNQRDIDLADRLTDELMTPNIITHNPGGVDWGVGIEGQKAGLRGIIVNNPDFHIAADEILFAGDKMFWRGSLQLNNPTTGAVESFSILEIDRIAGDKIAEGWTLYVSGKW